MEDGREGEEGGKDNSPGHSVHFVVCWVLTLSLNWRHGYIWGQESVINPDKSCSVLAQACLGTVTKV